MLTAVHLPWWVFIVAASVYVYKYEGVELVALGLGIDAYYGLSISWPIYTIMTSSMLLFVLYMRPYISL